ncbi:SRPBCC family protein [Vitiosangium sp. GDMCC 1.1324]|uniref:SRPBCC family protein n=1 Tax=Vitiosangium sp. (strain GDMCC 1.1324) TaxID=2138576 RepID=UPI000D380B24|nr:SRPBCC family protein [Vitiosangium sp. GDMCC 1.1324]PTL80721.1 polyketide cyclase [Vitiosangium sp. GDMCC 1.1324]
MLKKILVGLIVVIGALCGVIATRPSTYTVNRSATFKAPPDIAFALVNDFHHWPEWSPWDKLDPNQKTLVEGPAQGEGSLYSWSGNDQVGAGRMFIEHSVPNEFVRIKLEFVRPFASKSLTAFSFTPAAEGVTVSWTMEGHNDFMGKAFCLFMDMDKMVGKDFEVGLANMRKVAEAQAQKRAEAEKLAAQNAAPAETPPTPAGNPRAVAQPTP